MDAGIGLETNSQEINVTNTEADREIKMVQWNFAWMELGKDGTKKGTKQRRGEKGRDGTRHGWSKAGMEQGWHRTRLAWNKAGMEQGR
jgi:hypothetical protein